MGGKRAGRSNSSGGGRHMYPRISSSGSMKGSAMDFLPEKESRKHHHDGGKQAEDLQSQFSPRKSNFDIISILEGQEDDGIEAPRERDGRGPNGEFREKRRGKSPDPLPSFWHFVQPETSNHRQNEVPRHHKTLPLYKRDENVSKHKANSNNPTKNPPGGTGGGNPPPQANKRMPKRRKVKKKVQSAKVAGFEMLEKSPERLKREGVEWLRVLTPPPGADAASLVSDDDDEEEDDELIKRYFSGLSSAGSSISWAEDAMESEFTSQLSKLWEDIETACSGGSRPEKMSDIVYDECLQWRKAFPDTDLHRFRRNEAEVSPVQSPTIDDDDRIDSEVSDDAPFSALFHSPNYYNKMGRKGPDDSVNTLQANFRTLNCATPRPNIEKSTEYVSAWLSECQNSSYVPDHHQNHLQLLDPNNSSSRTTSPPLSLKNNHPDSASTSYNYGDEGNGRGKFRHSLRLVSDVARSTYAHYSRSHTKFISEPNPENFFTSLALANNQNYRPGLGPVIDNYGLHQSRINEYDEDGDADEDDADGRDSPNSTLTEIVSFRPNVRVQRPISSRIRDHTMTPIATGYPHASPYGSGGGSILPGINLNKQTVRTTASSVNPRTNTLSGSHENQQRRMMGIADASRMESCTSPTDLAGPGSALNRRIRSGLIKQGPIVGYGGGRGSNKQPQAPWSRHSGEDHLAVDTNYVTSLYENYPTGSGSGVNNGVGAIPSSARRGMRPGLRSAINGELRRSPTKSMKNGFLNFDRGSMFDEGPGSIPDCERENQPFKPTSVSWLMNRRVSPNP